MYARDFFHILLGLAALSCTALNPAYGDDAVGTGGMTSGVSAGSTSMNPTQGSTTAPDGTTSDDVDPTMTGGGTGSEPVECWRLPLRLTAPFFDDPQAVLEDVPILVDLSAAGPSEADDVRFYLGESLLPHELDLDGGFAWVRIPRIESGAALDFEAVVGPGCAPPALRPAEVWSNGFIAVWHFDRLWDDAFLDSVHGIPLELVDGSGISNQPWRLGRYLVKTNDERLTAVDERFDLSGAHDISLMGWVRLAEDQAGPLPWDTVFNNARHRELIAKLPGYRLVAVGGQTSAGNTNEPLPFLDIAQSLEPPEHAVLQGPEAVPMGQWTMVSGVYRSAASAAQCFVGGQSGQPEGVGVEPGGGGQHTLRVGRWLHGGIDELRISDAPRSPAWVLVQSLSMSGTLVEPGRPEPL